MNRQTVVRWWPPIGLLAIVLLGVLVGKRSTPLDDWFLHLGRSHRVARRLLVFTDARLVVMLYLVTIVIALARRRWRLAVIAALTPVVADVAVRLLKRIFGREKVGQLAYPSGHVTVTIVVLGSFLLVVGAALWLIVVATVVALLGLLGQAITFHYFTDTVGAVFLGTTVLCLAVRAAKLDRCQPGCDLHHSGG